MNRNRARHRVYSAGKLNQNAIAGGLDDAAFVLRYGRIDDLAPAGLEGLKGPDLIRTHQTAEARDVTRQNGRRRIATRYDKPLCTSGGANSLSIKRAI